MRANGHILLVEDEPINATFIEYQLAELGYSIAGVATSAEEALRLATENKPDLVLMDIQLEGELDGIETAKAMRGRLGIPVVYLTGSSSEEIIERARTTDAFGYLQKPFQEREVHSTVQMALAKAKMERLIQEERKWFATALAWVSDAVIAADSTGCVKLLNPAAERLTGWMQQEALGVDIDVILRTLEPATGERADSAFNQLMQEDGAASSTCQRLLVSKDGRQTPVEQTAAYINSDAGEVTGILIVSRERKATSR